MSVLAILELILGIMGVLEKVIEWAQTHPEATATAKTEMFRISARLAVDRGNVQFLHDRAKDVQGP
jgi:hypothetical protein